MQAEYRRRRIAALLKAQNPDGGWGYFAGKRSWLEPTAYALLALHEQMDGPAWQRGWELVRSWQMPDGGWRPNAQVVESHWTTALAVTLHCVKKQFDEPFQNGVRWLLSQRGVESTLLAQVIGIFVPNHLGHERKFAGWPWVPGTNSWIEPTAHALVALKKAAPHVDSRELRKRVALAEGMILRRRCAQGGWNYGCKTALGVDLPSYPETTGIALLGLQSCLSAELGPDLAYARHLRESSTSRLGKAWLDVSLRNFGVPIGEAEDGPEGLDNLASALEAIAMPNGGHALLKPAESR
jgi:hypothetical protein